MLMIRFITLLTGVLLASGCVNAPFQETRYVHVKDLDPKRVVEQFQANTAENFQLLNTVVFKYTSNAFMGMGYIEVDRQNGQFKVVCLNPLGVKLFELSGDRDTVVTGSAMPALLEYGNLPLAIRSVSGSITVPASWNTNLPG